MTETDTTTGQDQPPSRLRTYLIPVVVGTAAAAMLITGVVLLLLPKPDPKVSDPKDTVAITAQVEKFATAYNTYDTTKDVDEYTKTVTGLTTKEFSKKYVEEATTSFRQLASTKQKSGQARVKSVGIDSISTTDARVLAVVDRTVSLEGLKEPIELGQRAVISLQKRDGKWLVSKFEPIRAANTRTDPGGPIGEENSGTGQGQGE